MLVPSVTVWNVWELPLWAWRGYAGIYDRHNEQMKKINAPS